METLVYELSTSFIKKPLFTYSDLIRTPGFKNSPETSIYYFPGGLFWFIPPQVCYTARRMRTRRPAGESCRVNLSWIHSLDAPQWHCGDWSFTDVYTGAIRLEGEFTLGFYCHFSAQFNPKFTVFMTLAAKTVFVLLLGENHVCAALRALE